MFNIKEFFGGVRGMFGREMAARVSVSKALRSVAGIDIPPEAVSFSGGSAILKGLNASAQSAVFIKKSILISAINDAQKIHPIKDIR